MKRFLRLLVSPLMLAGLGQIPQPLWAASHTPSIATLKKAAPSDPEKIASIVVDGYFNEGDGGGGEFEWAPLSTAPEDGGLTFQVDGLSTGRWQRDLASAGHAKDHWINVRWFGAIPESPKAVLRGAFQQALAALRLSKGGTLFISGHPMPNGKDAEHETYDLQFPDIASDVDPASTIGKAAMGAKPLTSAKLIFVPPNVTLQGQTDCSGRPLATIAWEVTSVPVFNYLNADHSAAFDLNFTFHGRLGSFYPWSEAAYYSAIGLGNFQEGGPYENSSVISVIGSSNLDFERLTFLSAQEDNDHAFAIGFMVKGGSPTVAPTPKQLQAMSTGQRLPAQGFTAQTDHNIFRNIHFYDFVHGFVMSGQSHLVVDQITGDRRASTMVVPPGHILYLSYAPRWDMAKMADGATKSVYSRTPWIVNSDVTVTHITEGPNTLSNVHSLGTLALKSIVRGVVSDIHSQHPTGVIAILDNSSDLTIENVTWSTGVDVCATVSACDIPTLGSSPSLTYQEFSTGPYHSVPVPITARIHYKNISLMAPSGGVVFQVGQPAQALEAPAAWKGYQWEEGTTIDGLTIISKPTPRKSTPVVARPPITVYGKNITISNFHYLPVFEAYDPHATYDAAASIGANRNLFGSSDNVSIDLMYETQYGNQTTAPLIFRSTNLCAANGGSGCVIKESFETNSTAPTFRYPSSVIRGVFGTELPPVMPMISGDSPTQYWITPELPKGLALDAITGVLSGTPIDRSPQRTYQVSAADSTRLMQATLQISVNDATTGPSTSLPSSKGEAIRVYPNPWRADVHRGKNVVFDGLPENATVKIFTISGHLVRTLLATNPSIAWDLTTDSGTRVASGLYLYLATNDQGENSKGKIGVVR